MTGTVSIKELAQACGISVSAASKAMNNKKGISPEKAELVREKAKELGYCPNAVARAMRTKRSYNIGVLFNNGFDHEFFSMVLEAIHGRAEELGYDICFFSNRIHSDYGYYAHAMNRQCDGIIIAQGDFVGEQVEEMLSGELPVVSIEKSYPGHSAVLTDNMESMREIVRYLYSAGHRRIAFVCGEMGEVTARRIEGFKAGCRELGLDADDGYIYRARFQNPKASGIATRELLKLSEPPTCILYPDDVSALGGMTELASQGLRVPEDVSCFGYDGIRLASLLRPRLTTYSQNAREMGRQAVEKLISEIENPGIAPETVIVRGEIVPGDTVYIHNNV